jgi:hypothetical protein
MAKKASPPGETTSATTRKPKRTEQEPSPCWNRRIRNDAPIPGVQPDLREIFGSLSHGKSRKSSELDEMSQGIAVGEQDMPAIGAAFPSFCLEMFTSQSVLQASSCFALGGPTGSFKSHFVLEIANWIARAGGTISLAENESKFNADMARAVMGREIGQRVWVRECKRFNQVQEFLTHGIKKHDEMEDGERPPHLQIVDSVVGNSTESQQAKLKTEGSIERGYPANALAAANFLPSYLPMLAKKPYFGLWVTHSKDETEGTGKFAKTRTRLKGGDIWQYRCRLAFVLRRVTTKPEWKNNNWMVRLKLQLLKDAGIRGFTLPVTLRCTSDIFHNPKANDIYGERKIRFCWDEASLLLLSDPEKYGYPPHWKTVAKDVLGLAIKKSAGQNIFIAAKLGITPQDQVRDASVVMDALYESPTVLDLLRAEFGIQKGIAIQPGDDYMALLKQAKRIAMQRAALMKEPDEVIVIRKGEFAAS